MRISLRTLSDRRDRVPATTAVRVHGYTPGGAIDSESSQIRLFQAIQPFDCKVQLGGLQRGSEGPVFPFVAFWIIICETCQCYENNFRVCFKRGTLMAEMMARSTLRATCQCPTGIHVAQPALAGI